MNGYFRLKSMENGFGLELIPPTDNGEDISVAEVMDYLGNNNLVCDLSVLREKIESKIKTEIWLSQGDCPSVSEDYKLTVSEDGMSAIARFWAPSEGGRKLSLEEFVKDLRLRKIIFGIQIQNLQDFFAERDYCKDILVAKGKEVIQGTDAFIEYSFNIDRQIRPTVRDDGSVDFFNLNTINHCTVGQELARIIPEVRGHNGRNVLGIEVEARPVKPTVFHYGRNIEVSEDNLKLISKVNGHVTLIDDKVFVSDVLEVENVDNSTGNIEFEGSVQINGNVISNFEVHAKGNVIVNGVVEGAVIIAGGDIVIARGMNGMGKGKLTAGGNIIAKFLENAEADATGYVQTESILHSAVSSESYIDVDGKHGFITGGHVVAAERLSVKTLGSEMGASTVVEVGANPKLKGEYQALQKNIAETQRILLSTRSIIGSYAEKKAKGMVLNKDQLEYLKSVLQLDANKKKELENDEKRMEEIQEKLSVQNNAYVEVRGQVFPGTKVVIGELSMVVQNTNRFCRFEKVRGNVKCISSY